MQSRYATKPLRRRYVLHVVEVLSLEIHVMQIRNKLLQIFVERRKLSAKLLVYCFY
jgi:hypothetical protein